MPGANISAKGMQGRSLYVIALVYAKYHLSCCFCLSFCTCKYDQKHVWTCALFGPTMSIRLRFITRPTHPPFAPLFVFGGAERDTLENFPPFRGQIPVMAKSASERSRLRGFWNVLFGGGKPAEIAVIFGWTHWGASNEAGTFPAPLCVLSGGIKTICEGSRHYQKDDIHILDFPQLVGPSCLPDTILVFLFTCCFLLRHLH